MSRPRTRSSIPQEEREAEMKQKKLEEEKKLNRPLLGYSGKVTYSTTFLDTAMICDELLLLAEGCQEETFVVGFDMEWPFSFRTGPGKTALIQISPNLDVCHLLHLPNLKSLPAGLYEFLHHPKVKLSGINIKNDVRKLCRDFSGFDAEKLINSCIDLGVFANSILPFTQRWSMEKLVNYVLQKNINKDKKVRMSRWHIVPLTEDQQIYAAIDGYASLLIYLELLKIKEDYEKAAAKEQNQNTLNRFLSISS